MALSFDPSRVLVALAGQAQTLDRLGTAARKPALGLAEALLRAKPVTLAELRRVFAALEPDQQVLLLEGVSTATATAAIKRLDPHSRLTAKGAPKPTPAELRARLAALVTGDAEPVAKPTPLDKLLPAKERNQPRLAALVEEIGPERFVAALRLMAVGPARMMVKKLDPSNPKSKGKPAEIDADWARLRIGELAGIAPTQRRMSDAAPEDRDWFRNLARVFDTRPDEPER
ncbi:MAG: hypothetical protein ACFBRM_15005 [Pikeienuella sp.]